MFVDTEKTDAPNAAAVWPVSPPQLMPHGKQERSRLRVYIGAAAGVGKTYQMLEDAHQLRAAGIDVVLAAVETHGRVDTANLVSGLEQVSKKALEYAGTVFNELDLDAVIARGPTVAVVDELAHSNVPGSKNEKRWQDVLELLDNGISVITAVNIQHIETLNDAVAKITGVRVRETVPDALLQRADEVIDVDISVDTLRTRLRQGKIYSVEKIEQALANFFRKGNLATLRELALRHVALHQSVRDHEYREREGLEQAALPEKVMVCMASRGSAKKLLRTAARIVGRYAYHDWYAVYVATPNESPGRVSPDVHRALKENIALAESLGAKVIRLSSPKVADALLKFARDEGISHVIFGQSARSRWQIFWYGSVINRFLSEVKDAAVHVVPIEKERSSRHRASSQD